MLSAQTAPRPSAKRPRRRRTLLGRIVYGTALLLFIALISAAALVGYWLHKSPSMRQAAIIAATGGLNPDKAFAGKRQVNILLLGKDEDRDNHKRIVDTRGRTDTIIVARADFDSHTMRLLSIPRDSLVRIPGYRGKHKINSANQFGGPDLAGQTVEHLLGVGLDAHMLIDYKQFAKIIDMCGGVGVKVDKKLDYDDNWGDLHIHLKPGYQHLDGTQALGLVRYRKSNDGLGDNDQERIARQQRLISSLKSQVLQPSNLLQVPAIIETALAGSNTSLRLDQAMCLANFGRKIGPGGIKTNILPGTLTRSVVLIDEEEARRFADELFGPSGGRPSASSDPSRG